MGELFYFNFQNDGFGQVQINEPIGYYDIELNLMQKDKGFGRDNSFSGGEASFQFVHTREHYLDKLLYYYHRYGWESQVDLIIKQKGLEDIVLELDFAKAVTDDLEYFKCNVIQKSSLQIVKRRKETKVDVLSNLDIDGNIITPLTPINMLLLSKPVLQKSEWKQASIYQEVLYARGGIGTIIGVNTASSTTYYHINPCQNNVSLNINNSFVPSFVSTRKIGSDFTESDYKLITASASLKNIKINITELAIELSTSVYNGGDGYIDFSLIIKKGLDYNTAETTIYLPKTLTEEQTYNFSGDIIHEAGDLNRGESIWVYFRAKVRQSKEIAVYPFFLCSTKISGMKTLITAESTSYNSVVQCLRLSDVMAQVVKSISGLNINAPRYKENGEFYDTILVNGNFLRNIKDKPFYVSLDDIEKSLPEHFADWEIDSDGNVFFGIEKDYYTSKECGYFDNTQFSSMQKMYNPRFSINEFTLKYKNYQSLKENEIPNSSDTVHGESKYTLFSKNVENKKEATIEWTRDAYLIEEARKKGFDLAEKTSYKEDDTIFAIDTVITDNDKIFLEVSELNHTYNADYSRLSLSCTEELSFVLLGIVVGSRFEILPNDLNAGIYTVYSVSSNSLELTKIGLPAISSNSNGIRTTTYSYTIDKELIPLTNYTNESFAEVFNLLSPERFCNLRYSIRRNIENYYKSYLATCNLYWKEKVLKNTWYKNNGDCVTTYNGITLKEKEDILPSNPILSPFMYNDIIFANVDISDFTKLQKSIRKDRGFIKTIDNNNNLIKIYPISMNYHIGKKELSIKGEEKYEPIRMTITNQNKIITINEETKLYLLDYEIKEEKLYLYDSNRQLLYKPIYYNMVSINGATSESINVFKEWMELLRK